MGSSTDMKHEIEATFEIAVDQEFLTCQKVASRSYSRR